VFRARDTRLDRSVAVKIIRRTVFAFDAHFATAGFRMVG
jgi:hypothetical protein